MVTKVIIYKNIEDKFNKDVKKGLFNPEVRDLIEYWVTEIEDLGYDEYRKSELFKMLNDHKLKGDRQGQRSINLDQTGGRLIYSIIKNAIVIKVIKITSDHDYS
jgi:mRNA-degrading endonuclease YafQ of YafQ-DinJ toxin-antitoxin module